MSCSKHILFTTTCSLLLTLLFFGCDKDINQVATSPNDVFSADGLAFGEAVPQAYRAAGDTYREELFYYQQDIQSGAINPVDDPQNLYLGSKDELLGILQGYTDRGLTTNADLEKLLSFNAAVGNLGLRGSMTLAEARAVIDDWMKEEAVTVEAYPLTYHTLSVTKEALLKNQITRLQENGGIVQKGSNNNTLCTVSGFLCSKTNKFVSEAAQAALVLGVKQSFKTYTNWSATQQNIAVAAIKLILDTFWDNVFCKEDCDDCGPAAGIRAVYSNCNFTGLQAVGSFEYVEGFEYLIDENQDGVYDITREVRTSTGFVPESSLPSSPFKVIVDVNCDGGLSNVPGSLMPWPGGRLSPTFVDPDLSVAPTRPTANFTRPPLKGTPYPYYYDTNTQLCFSMTNVVTRGWTFVGWRTTTGGSPSTGNSTSSFCTRFSSSQATTATVNAEFSHPCSPTNYILSGPSFVICPSGACN